jgi:hypothetical protein
MPLVRHSHHLPRLPASPHPVQPLGSPIHLATDVNNSHFIPCSRRRSKPPARRRRLAPRLDFPPPHPFDDLPWISACDAEPDLLNPWDIADLSLIPDYHLPSSGPVRTRKSSLRSSPRTSPTSSKNTPSIRDTSLLPSPASVSTPPRPRFLPSRVLFHNLMPVVCDSSSDSCLAPSLINL